MKLIVWKLIGLLGILFMLLVDALFIKFVWNFIGVFYSKIGNYDIGTILLYNVVMGFIPFFLILFIGALLLIEVLFFLAPLIGFMK